jgi:hypothetical protein
MLNARRLQLDFELSWRSHRGIRAVEWPVGEGRAGTCCDTDKDQ